MRNCHEITNLSKQIQDQWVQLRSNSPSARAERERAVLAFSNSSQMAKHSAPDSINTPLSLSDGVVVQGNKDTQDSLNKATDVSDGDSSQDEVIDQSNQNEVSEYSSGTSPVQKNATTYRIRQTQLKEQASSEECLTVSTARTRLWRKHSTNIGVRKTHLQAIWKQQADEELARKKCTKEKEAQKKLVQEKQAQEILLREKAVQESTQEKPTEAKLVEERLQRDKLKILTRTQEEFPTKETPIQPHPLDVVPSLPPTPVQPVSALPITQQQSTKNPIRLVLAIILIQWYPYNMDTL